MFIFVCGLAGWWLSTFMMNVPIWHDESMYWAASWWIDKGMIYKDFGFLQMPYLPYIYHWVFNLFPQIPPILLVKGLNLLAAIISLVLAYLIMRFFIRNAWLVLSVVLILGLNAIFFQTVKYMANAVLPMPFLMSAVYCFVLVYQQRSRHPGKLLVFAGIFLGIATGIKLYYVVIIFPLFVYILFINTSLRKTHATSCFLAGTLLALLPAVVLFLHSPQAFWFNNLGYHFLNTSYKSMQGYERTMDVASKMAFGWRYLSLVPVIGLLVSSAFVLWLRYLNRQRLFDSWTILFLVLLSMTLFVALFPSPLWLHYLALPLPFWGLLFAATANGLDKKFEKYIQILVSTVLGFTLVLHIYEYEPYNTFAQQEQPWKEFHLAAEKCKKLVGQPDSEAQFVSISPHLLVEAGLSPHRYFTTGLFTLRLGHLLNGSDRVRYVVPAKDDLDKLFQDAMPKGFLTGFDGTLEKPFLEFAQKNGYKRFSLDYNGYIFYLNPEVIHEKIPEMVALSAD